MATLKLKRREPGQYDVLRLWDGAEEKVGTVHRLSVSRQWAWRLDAHVGYFGMSMGQRPFGVERTLQDVLLRLEGVVI